MIVRNCSGGVVFNKGKVFLLKNDKNEWVLPKGVIRPGELPHEVATNRVKNETGLESRILAYAGQTSYEFYSLSRQNPVCNHISWYIMESDSEDFVVSEEDGFKEGGFFSIEESLKKITYSQDKSLVNISYKKYCSL